MNIISRYVLQELLQVFLVALAALTLFMLVVGLVKEAQQQGLGFLQIAAALVSPLSGHNQRGKRAEFACGEKHQKNLETCMPSSPFERRNPAGKE